MREDLWQKVRKLSIENIRKSQWYKFVSFLAVIVVFCTTYALILPAITLETSCGIEEHTHTEVCYEGERKDGLLLCEQELHTHIEACYPAETENQNIPETNTVSNENIENTVNIEDITDAADTASDSDAENSEDTIVSMSTENEEAASQDTSVTGEDQNIPETNTASNENNENTENIEDMTDAAGTASDSDVENLEDTIVPMSAESKEAASEDTSVTAEENTAEALSETEENVISGGDLTDTAWWKIVDDGMGYYTLIIGGTGAMPDYTGDDSLSARPWYNDRSKIYKIIIEDGITYIGNHAFRAMHMEEITIGRGVKEIGSYAFSYLQTKECSIMIPGNVEVLNDYVFAYSTKITEFVFEEGVKSIGNHAFLLSNLDTITFPSTIEYIGYLNTSSDYVAGANLEYVVAEGNANYFSKDGVLYQRDSSSGTEKITLLAYPWGKEGTSYTVTDVDAIASHAFFAAENLLELTIVGTEDRKIIINSNRNFAKSSLEIININEYVDFQSGYRVFWKNINLRQINISSDWMNNLNLQETFNDCSALEKLTITKSAKDLQYSSLVNTISLHELTYDAQNAHISPELFGSSYPPRYDLIIGSNVDVLNGVETYKSVQCTGFPVILSHAETITFVGPNQITVKEGAFDGAGKPLEGISGTLWVDEQGIVYLYDAESMTASVVYCSPGVTECTIPESIEPEVGVVCNITAVSSYVFSVSDVQSITFENSANISEVAAYAFAECTTLEKINEVTTVDGAKQLFVNAVIGEKAFYHTALGGAISEDEEEPVSGTESETDLFIPIGDSADSGILVSVPKNDYYTGEDAVTTIAVSTSDYNTVKDKVFRIYFSAMDEGYSGTVKESFEVANNDTGDVIHVTYQETNQEGCYYLEIQGSELNAKTFSFAVKHSYPSPGTEGGSLVAWIEVYDSKEEAEAQNGLVPSDLTNRVYRKMNWTTMKANPTLGKSVYTNGYVTAGDTEGTVEIHDLSFKLTAAAEERTIGEGLEECGQDLIKQLIYEDVLTLPSGFYINQDIKDAIEEGNISYRISTTNQAVLFAVINGVRVEICTIDNFEYMTQLKAQMEGDKLKITWKQSNAKEAEEIKSAESVINYGPRLIGASVEGLEPGEQITFINDASITAMYTYSAERKSVKVQAEHTIEVLDARITLAKKGSAVAKYFGEEMTYTVTMSNPTAYPYTTGGYLLDPLDSDLYIKPEAMEEMFADEETGDKLQIVIKYAALSDYTGGSVTAADGSTEVILSASNTGANTTYGINTDSSENENSTVTLEQKDGILTVTATGEKNLSYTIGPDGQYTTIKEALNALGFFVTASATYEVKWDYNGVTISGAAVIEHNILVNVKDTFMLLGKDWPGVYRSGNAVIAKNIATFYDADDESVSAAGTANNISVSREIELTKSLTRNAKVLEEGYQAYEGDILQYTVKFNHYGEGDYEVLPVVDMISGAQFLLVPVNRNSEASWTQGIEIYGDEGAAQYYILTAGVYEDVWITESLCADSITVTNESGNIKTLIKLYYHNLTEEKRYSKKINYKTLVSPKRAEIATSAYSLGNLVWLNDHQGYRLFDGIGGGGSILRFQKDIVEEKGLIPAEDILNDEGHSIITIGEKVIYRLQLTNVGDGELTLSAEDIYDILPGNCGVFKWGTEGHSVTVSYEEDEGVIVRNPNSWEISDQRPGGAEQEEGQQYLVWKDDFSVVYPKGGTKNLYIYVTLQFPSTESAWDNLQTANGQNILYNTLNVYQMNSQVSHELGDVGEALLQKGIYKISASAMAPGNGQWVPSVTIEHIIESKQAYDHSDSYVRLVDYYTVLYNSGNARLYLNELVDELPKGFHYESMLVRPLRYSYRVNSINNTEAFSEKLVNIEGAKFVSAGVDVTVKKDEDGLERLYFELRDGDLSYDERREKYYLNPGEAVRFGYTVSTGVKNTEDMITEAVNSIAMAYDDYVGLGVVLDTNITVDVTGISGLEDLPDNDGTREIWNNAEAGSHGFSHANTSQWLASQVTLRKESILPGIRKKAVEKISAATGEATQYEGSVDFTDTVVWKTGAYNDGQGTIRDYMVSDVMESPYVFTGKVGLTVYNGQDEDTAIRWGGHSFSTNHLFEITERNGEELTVVSNSGTSSTLAIGKVGTVAAVSIQGSNDRTVNTNIKVLIEKVTDENGTENEKLSLIFDGSQTYDHMFSIPGGGMAVLSLATKNPTNWVEYRSFVNNVYITPLSQTFNQELVNNGTVGQWEDGTSYVRSSALMTVSGAYSTNAKKSVFEASNMDNISESSSVNNSTLLENTGTIFTYRLTVNTPDASMKYMTLIDNLPQKGDGLTFASSTSTGRNSEFEVVLAEDPNIRVTITDPETGTVTELAKDKYTITYSNKASGFDMDDKAGAGSDWVSDNQNARSIRLYISNENGDIVPRNSELSFYFDAVASDEVQQGASAWNSFGYSYMVGNLVLSAESDVVGVRFPNIPTLTKKLETSSGKAYTAEEDAAFRFLIYQGTEIDFTGMTEAKIAEKLAEESRSVTYKELMVLKGASETVPEVLNGMKEYTFDAETGAWKETDVDWTWTNDESYSVYEIPPEENSIYSYRSAAVNDMSGRTFTYNNHEKYYITFVNERKLGNLLILKHDSLHEEILLAETVFAFYSPFETDKMSADAITEAMTLYGLENMPAETEAENGDTYYLADIKATDSKGTISWNELLGNAYLVKELKAPNGYYLDDTVKKIVIDLNVEQQIITIANESSYELPESGGIGTYGITLTGIVLMLGAMLLLFKKWTAGGDGV